MKIRHIEAGPGEKAFGYLESSTTLSGIPIHIPVNIVRGVEDGPVLLVNSALHGREAIGTFALGKILRELDPKALKGTLIAVPVTNTSGFEFDSRLVAWDGGNLGTHAEDASLEGSPSNQLSHMYLNELVAKSDAVIDIHSGGSEACVWYTIYVGEHGTPEVQEQSKQMALAFGLKQLMRRRPSRWAVRSAPKDIAAEMGIPAISPEVGGGGAWYTYDAERENYRFTGHDQIATCERGIKNVMILMGMLEGTIETESRFAEIYDASDVEIWSGKHAGIILRHFEWGDYFEEGDVFATVYDPFTGEKTAEILAPNSGYVLNTGLCWPTAGQGKWLGNLGTLVEKVEISF